ncbi:sigma factor-like helix-turn-helix DNA-binding protein [Kribbella sp. NPDC056345]|uniref:sigma factor-like helix-turn-helix DNA-binding protein n=1 Tax=Kribbella sp. NPDC056345 TaxID=3345789 RepID=UPI0035D593C9
MTDTTIDTAVDFAEMVRLTVQQVGEIADPSRRARAAQEAVTAAQDATTKLGQLRRTAITAMLDAGLTQADIARTLDVSPERVRQLMSGGPRPARAVLGAAKLTVAIGGKHEAEKPRAVASVEAFAAYERLAEVARALGLDCGHEVVPPPGLVDLNRDNLIVLGSPARVPFLAQILPSDPAYGLDEDDEGWFVIDKARNEKIYSPSDSGELTDYGYVGRLPRPDGNGSFLYIAGLHAPGTLGTAYWLADNIDLIYRETRGKRWSALVKVDFDKKHRRPAATGLLTTIAKHEGSK